MAFSNLGLTSTILKALELKKYKQPYPIQIAVIPAILNNQDVLGIAPTGSGKTESYVLPLLTRMQESVVLKNRHISTLILVPTRELAQQVLETVNQYTVTLPLKIKAMAVYGGVSINPQMIALQGVSILIATPGRLLELVDSNAVHLSDIKTLVLDEADKMLNLGFEVEMNRVFSMLPVKRQNLLFSATLSDKLHHIHRIVLHQPHVVKIEEDIHSIDLIHQVAFTVEEEKKGPLLRFLIRSKKMQQVLIFTSSVYKADNVADKLRKNGIDAAAIHSKKSQGARNDALAKFKAGTLRVLVATDLMARGIDVPSLPYVINYELPRSPKDYIHRIGRTGRAENKGEAISFIASADEHHFKVIQKKMQKQVTLLDGAVFNSTSSE